MNLNIIITVSVTGIRLSWNTILNQLRETNITYIVSYFSNFELMHL